MKSVSLLLLSVAAFLTPMLPVYVVAEESPGSEEKRKTYTIGLLPALDYSADKGFGYGIVFQYDDKRSDDFKPYYLSHRVLLQRTTRGIQDYQYRFDSKYVLPAELRLTFETRYRDFARRLLEALVGADALVDDDPEALVSALESGSATDPSPGSWLGRARRSPGLVAVQDHRLWPYFARRFGLQLIETLEPKPGIAPTTRHLAEVVARVEVENARLILASPYFDSRHARFVAERTRASVVEMAHQPGARAGTDDYVATVDYNVRQVMEAL